MSSESELELVKQQRDHYRAMLREAGIALCPRCQGRLDPPLKAVWTKEELHFCDRCVRFVGTQEALR